MQTKKYSVLINAPKDRVWKILWNDDTYRQWTSVFSEGSYAESDWEEGSKIRFLTPEGSGMYSVIEKMEVNRFMSFRHDGEIKKGIEEPLNDESRKWSGTTENYTLSENEGVTELVVELGISEEMESYFEEHFPKALAKVKEIAEGS